MQQLLSKKVLVALSGGVDSAVTVLELQKQGFEVSAVYFSLLADDKKTETAAVRELAVQLKIKLITEDLREDFQKKILSNFTKEYRAGRTPNPCTLCNKEIKFTQLLTVADRLGIKLVATGHYACVEKNKGLLYIAKAKDLNKDQSYFLYRLGQKELTRVIFPLCQLTKEEVKKKASKAGLKVPSKESQDICFIKKGETLKDFLSPAIPERLGDIVSEQKEVLGQHCGTAFYTIGQRRGLKISGGPFYVISKDSQQNILVVTKDKNHPQLRPKQVIFKQASWVGDLPVEGREYTVKTRYLAREAKAKISKLGPGKYCAKLLDPQWAVTPGQSLVVYDKDLVIGGGVIDSVKQVIG